MIVPLNVNLHGHCVVSLSQSTCGSNGLKTWLSFLSSPMLALWGAGLKTIIYKTLRCIDCYQVQLTDISNKLLFMTFSGESATKYIYVWHYKAVICWESAVFPDRFQSWQRYQSNPECLHTWMVYFIFRHSSVLMGKTPISYSFSSLGQIKVSSHWIWVNFERNFNTLLNNEHFLDRKAKEITSFTSGSRKAEKTLSMLWDPKSLLT